MPNVKGATKSQQKPKDTDQVAKEEDQSVISNLQIKPKEDIILSNLSGYKYQEFKIKLSRSNGYIWSPIKRHGRLEDQRQDNKQKTDQELINENHTKQYLRENLQVLRAS